MLWVLFLSVLFSLAFGIATCASFVLSISPSLQCHVPPHRSGCCEWLLTDEIFIQLYPPADLKHMESIKDSIPSSLLWAILSTQSAQSLAALVGTGGHPLLGWHCLIQGIACSWSLGYGLGYAASSTRGWCGGLCLLPSHYQKHCSNALPLPGLSGKGNHLLNTPARCWNMLLTSGGKAHHIELVGGNLKWLKVLAVLQRKLCSLFLLCPQHSTDISGELKL